MSNTTDDTTPENPSNVLKLHRGGGGCDDTSAHDPEDTDLGDLCGCDSCAGCGGEGAVEATERILDLLLTLGQYRKLAGKHRGASAILNRLEAALLRSLAAAAEGIESISPPVEP